METDDIGKKIIEMNRGKHAHGGSVHQVLAHSYFVYFILFLVGVYLDFLFQLKIFDSSVVASAGLIILVLATGLIFWAQSTSRRLRQDSVITKENFCRGPYCYTRTPTHWGLFLLILGFGLIANAVFIILSTIVSFTVAKIAFIGEQERILAERYGTPYLEYKKSVRF
jgi:protein-S-isoprenylcysteine O-methyltransferase Ste14